MTANDIMLGLGLSCTLWCIGLVVSLLGVDAYERKKMIRLMAVALTAILVRTGERAREKAREGPRPETR